MRPSNQQPARATVVVTRDAARAAALATRLAMQGVDVVAAPVTRIEPPAPEQWAALVAAVGSIDGRTMVVIPSVNAADAFVRASAEARAHLTGAGAIAIGAVTRDALAAHRFDSTTPLRADAVGAADHVLAMNPDRVLWLRAEHGRDDGIERLRAGGVDVDARVAYRTVTAPSDDPAVIAGLDALAGAAVVCVYAPSQVEALVALLAGRGAGLEVLVGAAVVAIGETTAAALRDRGVRVAAIAAAPDPDAMASAIAAVYPAGP